MAVAYNALDRRWLRAATRSMRSLFEDKVADNDQLGYRAGQGVVNKAKNGIQH